MIRHHPDENILVEYSAGSLDWALGLAVSAHLHHCDACKRQIANYNKVGATLLDRAEPQQLDPNLVSNVLTKLRKIEHDPIAEQQKMVPPSAIPNLPADLTQLPRSVLKAVAQSDKGLKWRSISPSLKSAQLTLKQNKYEVAFHKIRSGGTVAAHGHKGLEVTVVLEGSFSDENGIYCEGDFLVRKPGQVHRPTATRNQDCLCLAVLAAPVELTGLLGRFINPFLSFRPA